MPGLVPGMTIHRARRWRRGKTAPESEHNKKRLSPEQMKSEIMLASMKLGENLLKVTFPTC